MKAAANHTIQRHGSTITLQHGIGSDHTPYLPAEKGPLGMDVIHAVCKPFDSDEMMNPGKLVWYAT